VAHRVKRLIYHPSQSIEGEPADGSVIMSFEICGVDEMKSWIMEWGSCVEVLEPGWLREDICKMANDIIQIYQV
jgi:proteasome accessory factor B